MEGKGEMDMIYYTGDIHGNPAMLVEMCRFYNMKATDTLIILGDAVRNIIDADAEKVRRLLAKHGFDRNSIEVLDASGDGETRSLIINYDGSMSISSISQAALLKRFHGEE